MSRGSLLFQRSYRISERADSQGLVAGRIATRSLTGDLAEHYKVPHNRLTLMVILRD
jgi:hypothetical protein